MKTSPTFAPLRSPLSINDGEGSKKGTYTALSTQWRGRTARRAVGEDGYTLVELLVSIAIIGIAFYALISVFAVIAPKDINARTLSIGAHLLNEKTEETLLKNFASVASTSETAFLAPFNNYYSKIIVDYVTTAEPDIVSGSYTPYKRIKVDVWGPALGTLEGVTLVTSYE